MPKLTMPHAARRSEGKQLRGAQTAHPRQTRRQARSVAGGRVGRRHAAPRNPPGRRASLRHRRHAAEPQRARAAGERSARRDFRPRPAGNAAERPDDQRHSHQRPEEHLLRASREDGEDERRLPRQQPPDADHRPHHFEGGAPGGRDLPDGRRPHDRTARVSTRSFRRWRSTGRAFRFAASAPIR